MKYSMVLTTAPSVKEARKLSKAILDQKLGACVQILPQIESRYIWKGKKESSQEALILIKTKSSLYRKLEIAIQKIHSYETPEIIQIPIQKGSRAYLSWISDSMY